MEAAVPESVLANQVGTAENSAVVKKSVRYDSLLVASDIRQFNGVGDDHGVELGEAEE